MTEQGPDISADQRLYLNAVLTHFRKTATWPILADVQRQLARDTGRSIDVLEILAQFPHEAHPYTSHLQNPAVLNVRALLMCDDASEEISDFLGVVQLCVAKYFGPDDEPTLRSVDLGEQLGLGELRTAKVLALLQLEPSILSGGTQSGSTWEFRVSDHVHHFQGIESVEEYVAVREELASAGRRVRSQERDAESVPAMALDDAVQRIRILEDRLKRLLSQDVRARYFDPAIALPLFDEYEHVVGFLKDHHPGLLSGISIRSRPEPSGTTDFQGRGYITREQLKALKEDALDCVKLVDGLPEHVATVEVGREGIFLAGQSFDALMHLRQLLAGATQHITVVDRFTSDAVLQELAEKPPGIEARIIMSGSQVNDRFRRALGAFADQYGGIEVRTSDAFHDRFLFIDEDSYHFGASFKDLGKKGFMFSRIEEPAVVEVLRRELSKAWEQAGVVTW